MRPKNRTPKPSLRLYLMRTSHASRRIGIDAEPSLFTALDICYYELSRILALYELKHIRRKHLRNERKCF